MDDLQQRIIEIAQQIPGYLGYEAKERRREMDRYTRGQLSKQYDELHTYLARVRAKAPLEHAVDLENLDQKLLRLIARYQTAPRGYAGWFDAAQIVDEDLDALIQFDAALASGVPQLRAAIDKVAAALKAKQGVEDAIGTCAETLDALNTQFNQREQFLATGKKPSLTITTGKPPESPLDALEAKKTPPEKLVTLANLKVNDAVAYEGTDYIVAAKITYSVRGGSFWAFLLQDGGQKRWLRVGPGGELAVCQEVEFRVPSPLPELLTYESRAYTRADSGQANVSVIGVGGIKSGSADYSRYAAADGNRLWIEEFGIKTRVMQGQAVDAGELKVYQR